MTRLSKEDVMQYPWLLVWSSASFIDKPHVVHELPPYCGALKLNRGQGLANEVDFGM